MEVPPGLRGIERSRQLVEGSIATIFLEIGLSVLGPEKPPRELEGAARLVEGPGGASHLLRWMAAGIETAAPLPTCRTGRIADALSDHADLDISVINQPVCTENLSSGVFVVKSAEDGVWSPGHPRGAL
jgi:hypothetical protein